MSVPSSPKGKIAADDGAMTTTANDQRLIHNAGGRAAVYQSTRSQQQRAPLTERNGRNERGLLVRFSGNSNSRTAVIGECNVLAG